MNSINQMPRATAADEKIGVVKLAAAAFIALLFLFMSATAVYRYSGSIYLNSGMKLYAENSPMAEPLLREAAKRNSTINTANIYMAKTLQKRALQVGLNSTKAKVMLIEAGQYLNNALRTRGDYVTHITLASNYELEGNINMALAHYNISLFLSMNRAEVGQWQRLQKYQADASLQLFNSGMQVAATIMAYNSFINFTPMGKGNSSQAAMFIKNALLSMPPSRWMKRGVQMNLPDKLATLPAKQQQQIKSSFASQHYQFLINGGL